MTTPPELIQPILRVFATALQLNRDDFTVFVEFSAHINKISVRYYVGGWEYGKEAYERFEAYTNGESTEAEIEAIADRLIRASAENDALIKRQCAEKEEAERKMYEALKAKFEGAA